MLKSMHQAYLEIRKYRKVVEAEHIAEKAHVSIKDAENYLELKPAIMCVMRDTFIYLEDEFAGMGATEHELELFRKAHEHKEIADARVLAIEAGITLFEATALIAIEGRTLKATENFISTLMLNDLQEALNDLQTGN